LEEAVISFMILSGPRSASTWAANWLTTDTTVCLHDPLLEYTLPRLEQLSFPGKRLGISCTSAMLYPDWVNSHDCPKIILYRRMAEINASLNRLGLVQLGELQHMARIDAIKHKIVLPYEQLFTHKSAAAMAHFLGVPFDPVRHDLLMQMRVEPMFKHLHVGREAVTDLMKRINEAR
jgi:hypothetical protein